MCLKGLICIPSKNPLLFFRAPLQCYITMSQGVERFGSEEFRMCAQCGPTYPASCDDEVSAADKWITNRRKWTRIYHSSNKNADRKACLAYPEMCPKNTVHFDLNYILHPTLHMSEEMCVDTPRPQAKFKRPCLTGYLFRPKMYL